MDMTVVVVMVVVWIIHSKETVLTFLLHTLIRILIPMLIFIRGKHIFKQSNVINSNSNGNGLVLEWMQYCECLQIVARNSFTNVFFINLQKSNGGSFEAICCDSVKIKHLLVIDTHSKRGNSLKPILKKKAFCIKLNKCTTFSEKKQHLFNGIVQNIYKTHVHFHSLC
ncbi:hypothetical protein RFI_26670 [Reticulomyxa filosa]|uniref:Uncharacterized protein n=1 Tax=Reticulomyxa filosa TaxID=46433 RepID=X6MAL4_RETFI|nr:hypothetical protein RFI_26670 [Reticulomyxa filosa]|eukprot:ETO10706.1 hypothetical protein RFI_26670 [Reticulomyxa filosa]